MNMKLNKKRDAFVQDMLSLIPPKYLSKSSSSSVNTSNTVEIPAVPRTSSESNCISHNENVLTEQKDVHASNEVIDGLADSNLRKHYTVSVLVRGDISSRIFSTWAHQLPRRCKIPETSFRNYFDQSYHSAVDKGLNIVVLPTTCDPVAAFSFLISAVEKEEDEKKQILKKFLTESFDSSPLLTNPKYIVDSIIAGHFLNPRDPKYQHNLQKELFCSAVSTGSTEDLSHKVPQECEQPVVPSNNVSIEPLTMPLPNPEVEIAQRQKRRNEGYLCARPPPDPSLPARSTGNGNAAMIKMLEELKGVYAMQGDEWRTLGYKKALVQLKKMPTITSVEQLSGVKGIGKRLREKIGEILESGALKKLKFLQEDPKTQAMLQISKVWGIGDKTADKLVKMGYHSVADLREKGLHLLTAQQLIGLNYYEELLEKIPRAEVERIYMTVNESCQKILPGAECIVCGSYRRGRPESGDVDILILPPPVSSTSAISTSSTSSEVAKDHPIYSISHEHFSALPCLVKALSDSGFLTDHLTLPKGYHTAINEEKDAEFDAKVVTEHPPQGDGSADSSNNYNNDWNAEGDEELQHTLRGWERHSYMGVCKLQDDPNSLHRRIDMKVYPRELGAFATLYFTGSDHFNRSMRLYAKRHGFHLSDKGLFRAARDNFDNPVSVSAIIPCKTEREIFQHLGLDYKEPWDRNSADVIASDAAAPAARAIEDS